MEKISKFEGKHLNEIVVKVELNKNKNINFRLGVKKERKDCLFEGILHSMLSGKNCLLKYIYKNVIEYEKNPKNSLIQGFEYRLIEPSKKENIPFDVNDLTGANEDVKMIYEIGMGYRF
ncbi:hypothetical protein JW949_03420 [Candidatus Woesearchaeota archaeon]|nr:hypothetical protein [Candidatus Woesearchaeota archaeon]